MAAPPAQPIPTGSSPRRLEAIVARIDPEVGGHHPLLVCIAARPLISWSASHCSGMGAAVASACGPDGAAADNQSPWVPTYTGTRVVHVGKQRLTSSAP
jgi:hypothetical protein